MYMIFMSYVILKSNLSSFVIVVVLILMNYHSICALRVSLSVLQYKCRLVFERRIGTLPFLDIMCVVTNT